MADTPNPATTEWVPLWDLEGSGSSGGGGPHAPTHETGGTDPITDLAGEVITSGTVADARLSANVQLKPLPPAAAHGTSHGKFAADPVPYMAVTNSDSLFLTSQSFKGPNIGLILYESNLNDNYKFQLIGGDLNIQGNLNPGATPAYIKVSAFSGYVATKGTLYIDSPIYERGRMTPMGEWTNYSPVLSVNAGTITLDANYGASYTLIGKTIIVSFYLAITLSTTPANIAIMIPGGFQHHNLYAGGSFSSSSGAAQWRMSPNTTVIELIRDITGTGVWPAGSQYVAGVATFQII